MENNYQHIQRQMALYCKDGNYIPIKGVTSKDRQKVYRELIFNVIENTLSSAYPITKALLSKQQWHNIITAFIKEWDCGSPYIWKMPQELILWAETKDKNFFSIPFFIDLLKFEWIEIEVYMMKDHNKDVKPIKASHLHKDILSLKAKVNLDHKILLINYPVFSLSISNPNSIKNIVEKKSEYYLIVWRKLSDYSVCYLQTSPIILYFLKTIEEAKEDISLSLALEILAKEGLELNQKVLNTIKEFCQESITSELLLIKE